ncbi:MAG TPA: succinyl-CoA synthetase subunit beta [Methanoregulaceae archaeon]|nr:succinyl-CoA synthetase subunit beta [Methanoregulaceae archaeon]HQJ88539.1 succinyl-CoA synthetase subunit beta [Methanoregulaceae archaeon]
MRLREYEGKRIFAEAGIPVPAGRIVRSVGELGDLSCFGERVVLKAQVDVGGRGKAGGVVICPVHEAPARAAELFGRTIRGLPVTEILVEECLPIAHEYYCAVLVDRSTRQPVVLFTEAGGVEIEETARQDPDRIRRFDVNPLLTELPSFAVRDLIGRAPKALGPMVSALYRVFVAKDALLAEINPLVVLDDGRVVAADAKVIIDDNALARQGFEQNRDLTEREAEAERHGFSYVELDGEIGVIGNGAGLTMATLDLIEQYGLRAANFLDVGGGADRERVAHAVRLLAGAPGVRVIIVNLLGGITRCDEVARGIIDAGIPQRVIVRMAGTNEAEGRALLTEHGYEMYDSMDRAVAAAAEAGA